VVCEECKIRPATVHYTRILNGEKVERHLCEECAAEKGPHGLLMQFHFPAGGMLPGFLNPGKPQPEERSSIRCESCGMTYSDFTRTGRFGCGSCYLAFDQRLDPLLRKVHGSVEHSGKTPKRRGAGLSREREILSLRKLLDEAVKLEAYEEAARLRDQIRDLEKQASSGGEPR